MADNNSSSWGRAVANSNQRRSSGMDQRRQLICHDPQTASRPGKRSPLTTNSARADRQLCPSSRIVGAADHDLGGGPDAGRGHDREHSANAKKPAIMVEIAASGSQQAYVVERNQSRIR